MSSDRLFALANRWSTQAFGLGLLLVAVYAVMRTLAAPQPVLLGWTAVAVVVAIALPVSGLTVLAAIGPFTEAVTQTGSITAVPILVAALGVSLLIGGSLAILNRRLPRISAPVALGAGLFGITLTAVVTAAAIWGFGRGVEAMQLWAVGLGAGLTILGASWLWATKGEQRPLVLLMSSLVVAALLSLADVYLDGAVRQGPLAWLLRPDAESNRLTGIIPAPNATAAIFAIGVSTTGAALLQARRRSVRVLAGTVAIMLLAATLLTQSRSGLLAVAAIGTVLAWSYRRWLGVLVAGSAALAIGLATYVAPSLGLIRNVPAWADEDRLAAWSAAAAMWTERPLTGYGWRSFEWRHAEYGVPLDAPHNEWLRFFAESGVVGGVAAVAFFVAAFVVLIRTTGWVAASGAATVAAVAVMASFNNPFMYVQVIVPAFLVIGTALGVATSRAASVAFTGPQRGETTQGSADLTIGPSGDHRL